MNKRVILVFLSIILLSNIIPHVSAADPIGSLETVYDTIYKLFGWITDVLTYDNLVNNDPRAVFLARFLIWLMLYLLTFFGIGFIGGLKEQKGIRVGISFVIALMGAAMLPQIILANIVQTYSTLGAVIVLMIPLLFVWSFINKIQSSGVKSFIYIIVIWLLYEVRSNLGILAEGTDNGIGVVFNYFGLIILFAFFGFLNNLVGVTTGRSWTDRTALGALNPNRSRRPDIPGDDKSLDALRKASKEAGAVQNDEEAKIKLTEKLDGLETRGINGNNTTIDYLQKIISHLEGRVGKLTPDETVKIMDALSKMSAWDVNNIRTDLSEISKVERKLTEYIQHSFVKCVLAEKYDKQEEKATEGILRGFMMNHEFPRDKFKKEELIDDDAKRMEAILNKIRGELSAEYKEVKVLEKIFDELKHIEDEFKSNLKKAITELDKSEPNKDMIVNLIRLAISEKKKQDEEIQKAHKAEGYLKSIEKYIERLGFTKQFAKDQLIATQYVKTQKKPPGIQI